MHDNWFIHHKKYGDSLMTALNKISNKVSTIEQAKINSLLNTY